jgi:hypothetical protein
MAGSTQIVNGTFVNVASTPKYIAIPNQISKFQLWNLTASGQTALGISGSLTSDVIVEGLFLPSYMASGTGIIKMNGTVAGTIAPLENGAMTINGFSLYDSSICTKGPTIAVSSFTPGQPTVFVTGTNHGFQVGDNVRIVSMTTAPELGGLIMTVTATNGTNQFTTLLDSTNSLTSVGSVYKVGNAAVMDCSLYYPQYRAIAKITLANPMVVTTLVQQNYQIGNVVRFDIPTVFGMQDLNSTSNGLPVQFTVIAVNNAVGTQTVTLAVDSTAFTAFAWPLAADYPFSLPVMIPQGEGNINNFSSFGIVPAPLPYANQNILGFARQNLGSRGVLIGAGDGTNSVSTGGIIGSDVSAWYWEATTVEQSFSS